MARSIWTGSISFGLVNIPIKLFSAVEPHRVAFHEFEVGTGQRIRHKRVAETSGREVPWEKISKGFEVAKGRYVMLTDEELETAEPKKTSTIEIEQFVPLADIDPVSWDQSYYLGPDGAAAVKAYALLREAMEARGRVAIGRFVMRTKEYVACIRPLDNVMALQTMFFPDEVRSTKEIGDVPKKVALGAQERAMAGQLIESLTSPWDPAKHRDTFSQRVMDLVRRKDKGKVIAAPAGSADEGDGKVLDLMAALKATLARPARGGRAVSGRQTKVKASARAKNTSPARAARGGRSPARPRIKTKIRAPASRR